MLAMIVLAAVTSGCTPLEKAKGEPDYRVRPITGAFVYVEGVQDKPDEVAKTLKRLGLCTVIFRADRPAEKTAYDKITRYVAAARKQHLTIYIGLNYGDISPGASVADLQKMADEDHDAALEFETVAFDGWYLAREIYNFSGSHQNIRRHYIERLLGKLRSGKLARKYG